MPYSISDTSVILKSTSTWVDLEIDGKPGGSGCAFGAHVDCLPPELLSEIFLFCLPGDFYIRPDPLQAPLLICGVCGTWRRIAIALSRLWSSLAVKTDSVFSLAELWLQRSGNLPLSVDFVYGPPLLLVVMMQCMHRWQHVKCTISANPWNMEQPLSTSAPLLKTFHYSCYIATGDRLRKQLNAITQSALHLHSFTCSSIEASFFSNTLWSRLTVLEFYCGLAVNSCVEILRNGTQLLQCTFARIDEPGGPQHVLVKPTNVPRLSALIIQGTEDLSALYDHLILPSLRHLDIAYDHFYEHRHWRQVSFMDFLSRSSCDLEYLALSDTGISEDDLVECLQRISGTLITLEIDNCKTRTIDKAVMHPGDKVLSMLTFQQGPANSRSEAPCLCPKLEVIRLGHDFIFGSEDILANMIESRWKLDPIIYCVSSKALVSRLRSVTIIWPQQPGIGKRRDIQRLLTFRQEGLRLRLQRGPYAYDADHFL